MKKSSRSALQKDFYKGPERQNPACGDNTLGHDKAPQMSGSEQHQSRLLDEFLKLRQELSCNRPIDDPVVTR